MLIEEALGAVLRALTRMADAGACLKPTEPNIRHTCFPQPPGTQPPHSHMCVSTTLAGLRGENVSKQLYCIEGRTGRPLLEHLQLEGWGGAPSVPRVVVVGGLNRVSLGFLQRLSWLISGLGSQQQVGRNQGVWALVALR